MAYPTVSAPYGLKPINRLGGTTFVGAVRHIKIASGFASNIFNGDLVSVVTAGVVEKFTGTTSGSPVGVFVGCSFTNPTTKQLTFAQNWPASTVAADAVAYVVDDPSALFSVVSTDGSGDVTPVARAVIGSNLSLVQGAGSTITGNSGVSVLGSSTDTTATLPIRVVDVVPETATDADEFVELIVKINIHQYNNTTGV
jgi:hypothetical protein